MPKRLISVVLLLVAGSVSAQSVLSGRLRVPRSPGSDARMPLAAVWVFASPDGSDRQPVSFRTWETAPAGWYHLAGPAGDYTVLFSTPGFFMRPQVLTNIHLDSGEKVVRDLSPVADYAVFDESAWDRSAAGQYDQCFVARSTSVTQVGFRLAHDGVDGAGPGSQNLLVSIHRCTGDNPANWAQVGPEVPVLNVDSGGPKNYIWCASFNSGEVPLQRGERYAVRIRAEKPGGHFQPFWSAAPNGKADCYRGATASPGFVPQRLWMSVSGDGDGLLIPCNKRVQKEFGELTHFARRWSQTYIAQGHSLAGVILYAACSGVQPSQNRQRVRVTVRAGGPDGAVVGIPKIAIGNANYTGDASWGSFGTAFSPREVPLEPGKRYCLEFESIENYETLHGFINAKHQPSDDKPGFNPYRRNARDPFEQGRAYRDGTLPMDYSLDMQVVEYAHPADDWHWAVEPKNLLSNGDMQAGSLGDDPAAGRPEAWKAFAANPATIHEYRADGAAPENRILRITGETCDGGWVQRVDGLSRGQSYRLSAKVRCSFIVDDQKQCMVGYDPTGQTDNPDAPTIVWTALPRLHGVFVEHASAPIRPAKDAISVFLRAQCSTKTDFPFRADFDDVRLQEVKSGTP